MNLKVYDFPQEINLCKKYKGKNISPEISWNIIENAKSYSLIMEDPKAVGGTFVHWYIPYISNKISTISFNYKLNNINIFFGKNSLDKFGYTGPCPPVGTGMHNYIFKIYALDNILTIDNTNIKIKDSKMFENILKEKSIKCLKKKSVRFNYKYK